VTQDARDVASTCDLIVTTTPATAPLLRADDIRPGTHITAVGSDTAVKQELDPAILAKADVVVADSIKQCRERGEIHHAIASGHVRQDRLAELGDVIAGKVAGRTSDGQITVADLTGVAVQDIQISKAVYETLGY
jgi:ornithine cyclodeaminase